MRDRMVGLSVGLVSKEHVLICIPVSLNICREYGKAISYMETIQILKFADLEILVQHPAESEIATCPFHIGIGLCLVRRPELAALNLSPLVLVFEQYSDSPSLFPFCVYEILKKPLRYVLSSRQRLLKLDGRLRLYCKSWGHCSWAPGTENTKTTLIL